MSVIVALWHRNLKKFMRNKVQLGFTMVMPFFFLYVFGAIFTLSGVENAFNYMLAGIIITNVFQTAMTVAATTIDDITTGFMKEVLVSPVRRIEIAAGQILSGATVATVQSIVTVLMGFFIGLRFTSLFTFLAVVGIMVMVGIVFAGFGLFLAASVKNMQAYQVINVAIAMPMTFLCGAYIPLSLLPDVLRYIAYINPMTYATAFFRTVMLENWGMPTEQLIQEQLAFEIGGLAITPWWSAAIVAAFGALFLAMSTIVFTRVDFSKINRSRDKDQDVFEDM